MDSEKNIIDELYKSREDMLERGFFSANGYEFKIKPIFLGEERDFLKDFKFIAGLIPQRENPEDDSAVTDEEKAKLMITFFTKENDADEIKSRMKAIKKHSLIKLLFLKIFNKKIAVSYDYEFYSNTLAYGLVKWIEQKVYHKNKLIKFYDLERKYGLSKIEIYDLIIIFLELSNFPLHLPRKKL